MSIVDGNWKTFMARATVLSSMLGIVVFGAVKLAVADPGGPASPDALTFAGVLRTSTGAPFVGSTTLTFVFRKVGDGGVSTEICRTTTGRFDVGDGGAFSTPVPMDPIRCPRSLFDGATVVYDVLQGTEPITPDGGVAITPIPYARFADQTGVNNDCPVGYERTVDPVAAYAIICHRGEDQVVRVGTGASAFWIDRFEASVWSNRDSGGTPFFLRDNDFPATAFPRNGQWRTPGVTTSPIYASSRYTVAPSRFITWFQASEACAASGKRLPTGEEWLRAAQGTFDPGDTNGDVGGRCRTGGGATEPRNTGLGVGTGAGTGCVSGWGAVDMIGNLREWTAEWQSNTGTMNPQPTATPWTSDYNGDGTLNVASYAYGGTGGGAPAAVHRGGGLDGTRAGIFFLGLNLSPAGSDATIGFRCVIPR